MRAGSRLRWVEPVRDPSLRTMRPHRRLRGEDAGDAEFLDRRGLQAVKDVQFVNSRLDDFASQFIHPPGAGNCLTDAGQFVRVFAAAEATLISRTRCSAP